MLLIWWWNSWVNATKFLTGASAIGSIAIPVILKHAGVIGWGALAMELSSFFIFVLSIMFYIRMSAEEDYSALWDMALREPLLNLCKEISVQFHFWGFLFLILFSYIFVALQWVIFFCPFMSAFIRIDMFWNILLQRISDLSIERRRLSFGPLCQIVLFNYKSTCFKMVGFGDGLFVSVLFFILKSTSIDWIQLNLDANLTNYFVRGFPGMAISLLIIIWSVS